VHVFLGADRALPICASAINIHRPQRSICAGLHQRHAKSIAIAQQRRAALQSLGHQTLFESVFEKITVEMCSWVDRPSQIADLPAQHNAMANQQWVDHIPLRVNIIGCNEVTNTHSED
jgi:hypothetical protein